MFRKFAPGTPGQGQQTDTPPQTETTETTTEEVTQETTTQDDSQSEQQDTEQSTEQGKEIYFHDPKDIPEELQPIYKKLQGAFTRKMQILSGVAKKAEAFDQLVKMPSFRTFMNRLKAGNNGADREEEDVPDAVESRTREIVKQELSPIREKAQREALEKEFGEFKEKYPFHENYSHELRELLVENPDMTFEQALAIAAFPDLIEMMGQQLSQKISMKKRGNVTKPNKGASATRTPPGQAKTVLEAWEQAKRQLGQG